MNTFAKIYYTAEPVPRPIQTILIQTATGITFLSDPTADDVEEFLSGLAETDWLWILDRTLTLQAKELAPFPLKRIKYVLSEHGEIMWEDPACRKPPTPSHDRVSRKSER